jgi:CheY-like chemotaxis protein
MSRTQWKKTIETLRKVEELALEVYQSLASHFEHDAEFAFFLRQLADDEALHRDLLIRAVDHLAKSAEEIPPPKIVVDENTRREAERPLHECLEGIRQGTITKQDAIDRAVLVELSEWNAIFLYVVSFFQDSSRLFQEVAAAVHDHQRRIQDLVDALPPEQKPPFNLRGLPPLRERAFCVVDDEASILELVTNLLIVHGHVVTSASAEEALEKLDRMLFDVVIADVEMPGMDGSAFYRRAVEIDPSLRGRFLFYTGSVSPYLVDFCRENGIPCLEKPVPLNLLKTSVFQIASQPRSRISMLRTGP